MVEKALYVREVTGTTLIPEFLSVAELMRRTGISRSTIDRLCAQGRLEKRRLSDGRVGITVASWERHLAQLNSCDEAPALPEPRLSRRRRQLQGRSAPRRAHRQGSAA
jgi:uncharacterized small protein (DUF1192 family)